MCAIRKLAMGLAVAAVCAWKAAAAPAVAVENAAGMRETTVSVRILLSGGADVTALQFEIAFDSAVFQPGAVNDGASVEGRRVVSFSPTIDVLRVVIYSRTNAVIANGAVATVPFTVSSTAPFGSHPLFLRNAIFSNSAGAEMAPGPSQDGLLIVTAGIAPRLGALDRAVNGDITFFLTGNPGVSYVLQRTSNFVTWTPFTTNSLVTTGVQISDNSLGVPYRFYRALEGQ